MAVTHFLTQFTHVSRHFGAYSRKQTKLFRENCFENVVSDYVSTKLILETSRTTKKITTKNHESNPNLWRILGTKQVFF